MTINQVAKKWATRALKDLAKQGDTYNPDERSIIEFGGQQYWDPFLAEVKEASDYKKILHSGGLPRRLAYDLVEQHAEEISAA